MQESTQRGGIDSYPYPQNIRGGRKCLPRTNALAYCTRGVNDEGKQFDETDTSFCSSFCFFNFPNANYLERSEQRHDIQQNDTQQNGTQKNDT